MPATTSSLRKRKSRTSTPYLGDDTPDTGSDPKKQKLQSSLDGWVEPPMKNPAPSFEEHGFARHGVLETMAPLGALPSTKMKQRARAMGDPAPPRRSMLGKNGNMVSGEDAVSTPEMTPAPDVERDESDRVDDEEVQAAGAVQEEEEEEEDDLDFLPIKARLAARFVNSMFKQKTSAGGKPAVQVKTPVKNGTRKTVTPLRSPATQGPLPQPQPTVAVKQRIQIAVNDAIQRANMHQRPNIGYALKRLHEQSQVDPHMFEVLESILHQNATPEQQSSFKQFVKDAKKLFKKILNVQSTEESPFRSTPRAAAAATTGLATKSAPAARDTELGLSPPFSPDDHIMADAPADEEQTAAKASVQDLSHPLTTAPTLRGTRSSSLSRSRVPSKSPPEQLAQPVSHAESELDPDIERSAKALTPAAKSSPSGAEGSDSDLSEVNEEIVQNGPPEPSKPNAKQIAAAKKKAHLAQLAQARKKARANSAKPNGRYEKKPPPTAKDLAEEMELQAKRQAMAEKQPSRLILNPPTSDLRFEDEMLETESLTESMIAVGPPIDIEQPRRAPRVQRNGTFTLHLNMSGKRVRDEQSAIPSPQPGSAASTRPTTPALVPPGPKRLKLNNGQAARTKRSPVKNRDGPIAGIAHQGGGGLRPLGPDDNDPDSPQTESDDWCAACKGAGEFVCCEGCPRVFHFLCLDPPRTDAPEGSFLCNECTARLKPSEEHVVRPFKPLGALFKQLESTNTRAFALPSDIQEYFADIEARPDGSYFEQTKKFPLAKSSGYGYQKPDYLKTSDSNHKPVLCAQCGNSSGGRRPLMQCDYCHAYWHLDCCDPPLANTPHVSLESSHRDAWKCPRHIDHDLRSGLLLQNDLSTFEGDDVAMHDVGLATRLARRVRKPRKPSVIEPAFSRGTRNNGLIDIINDPDDETDGEGNYVFSPNELDESKDLNSKLFRIPEKGVVLDFVAKVKQDRIEKRRQARKADRAAARHKASLHTFVNRPIEQQQTALHLAKLAGRDQELGLNDTTVDALILSLTAEAPDDVVSAIGDAPPARLTDAQATELVRLQKLIERTLDQHRQQTVNGVSV